jgi:hypothetical protein
MLRSAQITIAERRDERAGVGDLNNVIVDAVNDE